MNLEEVMKEAVEEIPDCVGIGHLALNDEEMRERVCRPDIADLLAGASPDILYQLFRDGQGVKQVMFQSENHFHVALRNSGGSATAFLFVFIQDDALIGRAIAEARMCLHELEEAAAAMTPPTHPDLQEKEGLTQGYRILVVDDSPTMRKAMVTYLEHGGFKTDIAFDGAEAVDKLERERPDLVLTDLEMPNLDGFGLLAKIKEHELWKHTPVVMCTTNSDQSYRDKARGLGASGFVAKPFTREELLSTVKELVF